MSGRASWRRLAARALLLLVALAPSAWAHGPGAPSRPAWRVDPLIALNLSAMALVYAAGLRRLWRRAGVGGGVSRARAGMFAGGVLVLAIALLSPVDRLSDELQWVHMVQHMLLMNVAAPLVVAGAPLRVALWSLPLPQRRRWGGALTRLDGWRPGGYLLGQAALTWTLYAGTLWVWHLPRFYEAALRAPLLHDVQHLTFFVASAAFWRALLDPLRRLALAPALGVVYLFATSLHATALGVFMALSPAAWYPIYAPRVEAWGLGLLEDQQLAGLIMWMPACMVYALVAAAVFGAWLRDEACEVDPA